MGAVAVLRLHGVTVDLDRGVALRRGHTTALTPTEGRLLAFLHAAGTEVPRDVALREVWGYRKGVESRTLDTTMRRLRAKVELDPAAPRHLLTVHGRGYRFVAAPSLPAPGLLVGRETELAEGADALARGRVLSVVGRVGMGRSTLAYALASGWGPASTLARAASAEELDVALAVALGLRAARSPGETMRAAARLGEHLLVATPVGDEERRVLAEWLPSRLDAAPGLRAIVVANVPLGLAGERVCRVGGLPEHAAVALLRARSDDAAPERELRALARAWDGWPLALALVAERLREGGPTRVEAPLEERSVQAILSEAWEATSPPGRRWLAVLALCRPGAPREWLERVWRGPVETTTGPPDAEVRGWLVRGDLRLPDAIGNWVRARPESAEVAGIHARLCLEAAADPEGGWVEEAELAVARDVPEAWPLALAVAERALGEGNVAGREVARARALRPREAPEEPLLVLDALYRFTQGDVAGAAAICRPLLKDPLVGEVARVRLAQACVNLGDHVQARRLIEAGPLPALGDLDLFGGAVLATVLQVRTDPAGVGAWRTVLGEAERRGRRRLLARWLPNLAVTLRTSGREGDADRVLRRAIVVQAEVGDVRAEATSRVNLAQARYDLADFPGAEAQLGVIDALLETCEVPRVLQHALAVRAAMAIEAGDTLRARSLLEEARVAYAFGFGELAVWGLIGTAWWREGELLRAEEAFDRSLEILAGVAAPPRVAAVTRARWRGVRAERGLTVDAEGEPELSALDPAASALAVERLHPVLTDVVARRVDVSVLRTACATLPEARTGIARVSRTLLWARARRAGVELPELL